MTTEGMARLLRRHFGVIMRNDFSPIGSAYGRCRESLAVLFEDAGFNGAGVEIGVHRGYFSACILEATTKVHLHSVDPWGVYRTSHFTAAGQVQNERVAREKLAPWVAAGRCTIHKDYSLSVVGQFADGSLDFVFIDGDHSFDAAVEDIIHWTPKVRAGGIVAVHDYCPGRRAGVMEAVEAYTKCHMIHPWFVIREEVPTAFWVR